MKSARLGYAHDGFAGGVDDYLDTVMHENLDRVPSKPAGANFLRNGASSLRSPDCSLNDLNTGASAQSGLSGDVIAHPESLDDSALTSGVLAIAAGRLSAVPPMPAATGANAIPT